MKKILSDGEVSGVLSMNKYWEEVSERENQSPLDNELNMIVRRLGVRILFIIAEYAKLQKEEEKENADQSKCKENS